MCVGGGGGGGSSYISCGFQRGLLYLHLLEGGHPKFG